MTKRTWRTGRPWLWALAAFTGALLVMFALVIGPWLFTRYPQHGLDAEQKLKARNDVRTTLIQALGGLAVAGGVIVTYRTFRQSQRDQASRKHEEERTYQQRQAEQDRTYALRQAEQVNEFFTKAVEQLGHEQAPVRLGALYSLVNLAQTNPEQRQTVVDVICAYLRMPYTPPDETQPTTNPVAAAADASSPPAISSLRVGDAAQELEVRLTAQRLLAAHLRHPSETSDETAQRMKASPDKTFWPGISLDLTGAALVGLDLHEVSIVRAKFLRATFTRGAWFYGATFIGDTRFDEATFIDLAVFSRVTFTGDVWFNGACFSKGASFDRAATFCGAARFVGVSFTDLAFFDGAIFADLANFRKSTVTGAGEFAGATFNRDAVFDETTFNFATFSEATFAREARFKGATFDHGADFERTHVLNLDDPDLNKGGDYASRSWPDGWTVRPDSADPSKGTLVRTEAETAAVQPTAGDNQLRYPRRMSAGRQLRPPRSSDTSRLLR